MKDRLSIEAQADRLARWLDEHPGSAPPADLDEEVLEAIYLLRPDLAPAASLNIDDILAEITTGPFAAPQAQDPAAQLAAPPLEDEPEAYEREEEETAERGPEEETEEGGQVIPLAPRRRWRAWMWSSAGALAAAAMALVVVRPYLGTGVPEQAVMAPAQSTELPAVSLEEADPPIAEAEYADVGAAHAPAPTAKSSAPSMGAAPSPDAARPRGAAKPSGGATASATATDRTLSASGEAAGQAPARSGLASQPADERYAAVEDMAPVEEPVSADLLSGDDVAETTLPALPAVETASELAEGAVVRQDEADADADEPAWDWFAGKSESQPQAAPASVALVDMEEESEELAVSESVSVGRTSTRRSARRESDELARSERKEAKKTRAKEKASAAPAAPEPEPVEEASSMDELRSRASSFGYRDQWFESDPGLDDATRQQLAAVYAQAESAAAQGSIQEAIAALKQLMGSGSASVVQDAAWRAAVLEAQIGATAQALTTVQQGLAASSQANLLRSRLLSLEGSLLEELGRTSEAAQSYQEAAEINEVAY